ncbi:interferon regulatory factor 9 [Spea bombifrons]|uniref:interferon regulatory factor 9 n=1 Tax=Spea bombifrons TaxID=233779 RepID=UPI00234A14C2|nr:interferon regulatory factor 9 [Spea bombifrons]XP_053323934.1 interferon regulatory factor 9 [Spea bombifrons]
MASGRARSTRKLKPWLVEQVESGKFPGLVWDDEKKNCFRIPWKHAGKQDFRHDEDAAIFKAWALFKNKLRPEDKIDPAAWKTRLRCALNKSPEFEEVPERSQLDISEPYKVYRIVPPAEQVIPSSGKQARKRKRNVDHRDSSSDETETTRTEEKPQIFTLEIVPFVDTNISSTISTEDSGVGSDTNSTEMLNTHYNPEYMEVTVLYSGVTVSKCLIQKGECKLSAGNPPVGGHMEHVLLPAPDEKLDVETRDQTKKLLKFLQAGVMLASNVHGIFAQRQRSCSGRIFWMGPCANQRGEPNKLERDAHVKLFDTQNFLRELELYRMQGGIPPGYQVTLCFGEEISDSDPSANKLITAQIEQVMAKEMVGEAIESHFQIAQSSNPLVQSLPATYLIPLASEELQEMQDHLYAEL